MCRRVFRFLEKLLILCPVCRRVFRVCSKMVAKGHETFGVPRVTFGIYNTICFKRQLGAHVLRATLSIIQTPFSQPPWVPPGTFGYLWVPVGTSGYFWAPLGTPLGTSAYLWVPLRTPGYLYLPLITSSGYPWVPRDTSRYL